MSLTVGLILFAIFNHIQTSIVNGILTANEIDQLRVEIMNEIDTYSNEFSPSSDKPLAAHILRLVFHDCAGPENTGITESTVNNDKRLCDGCIDLDLKDHAGLNKLAVQPLEVIYSEYKSRISRADFWATAGNIALEYTASLSPKQGKLRNLEYYFGRIDCPLSPNTVTTPGMQGTEFPLAHLGWDPAFEFFRDKLGLNVAETTALFGAHTIGKMHKANSGFSGQWTHNPHIFDNEFFVELFDRKNEWDQTFISPKTKEQLLFPQWKNAGKKSDETELTMLNSDYSLLVRMEEPVDNPNLDENTGIVNCRVEGFGLRNDMDECRNEVSFNRVRNYAISNQRFYDSFGQGWNKILTNNQDDLIQVIPNEFRDDRPVIIQDNLPTIATTKAPTKTPMLSVDVETDTPSMITTNIIEIMSEPPSFCCIAKKVPNWNGRCWGNINEESCNNVNAGDRCYWDVNNCRSEQLCSIRDTPCTSGLQCCSTRCRNDNGRCR